MNKPTTAQLRSELVSLGEELQSLGVRTLAYPVDLIDSMSRGTLESCIEWASELVHHIKSAA